MPDQTVERDRMVTQVGPAGFGTLGFAYKPGGQVSAVQSSNANGNNLAYSYDNLNRPATIQDGTLTTVFKYDSFGNLTNTILPNGVTMVESYDTLNRLNGVTLVNGNGTIAGYGYTLGPTGNRLNMTETTGRAVTWTPDNLYRLVNEAINSDPTPTNDGGISYVYDNVGNRQNRYSSVTPIPSQTFSGDYNAADELNGAFSYDQNGNQLTDSLGRTYTYNSLNQLTQVTGTNLNVSYVYDADGLRVQKTNNLNGTVTKYLWDRNNLTGYPQVSEELTNGVVTRRYVYGPQGPLYMTQLISGSWTTSYFGKDAQNVRFLMDGTGTITDQYTYDAFGNQLSTSGLGTPNNMGYDGEYADSDTGLVYLRARWMNTTIGRFMEMDKFPANVENPLSLHRYVFVANDPENRIDPHGTDLTDSDPILYWVKENDNTEIKVYEALYQVLGNHGVTIAIGVKDSDPKKYSWVQKVTYNIPFYYLPKDQLFGPGQYHYDGTAPSSTPEYYYEGREEPINTNGYQNFFTDGPYHDDWATYPNPLHASFILYFVKGHDPDEGDPVALVKITYGYTITVTPDGNLKSTPDPLVRSDGNNEHVFRQN